MMHKWKIRCRLHGVGKLMIGVCVSLGLMSLAAADQYALNYHVKFKPPSESAQVRIEIGRGVEAIKRIRFRIDSGRYRAFASDSKFKRTERYVYWYPKQAGDSLRYKVDLTSERDSGEYDGILTPEWGIFRGDDLVPPASVRTSAGAKARAHLVFEGPKNWSLVGPYHNNDGVLDIVNPARRFDRPVGWFAAGELGVRREQIGNMEVAVAGPMGQDLRRMDMLAFLNWNLPALLQVVRSDCRQFVVVSAADPMWRGGLSGPCSLYVHRDRPLISENGTSTLLHEVFHSLTGMRAIDDDDWIVEGLAEFYSIEIMRRSGTLTGSRSAYAMRELEEWGSNVKRLPGKRSSGAVTARAVLLLARLDQEISRKTAGRHSLDTIVAMLQKDPRVSLDSLRRAVQSVIGQPSEALRDRTLLRASG